MNIFARFDENPAMTLQDIKKKKLRTDARTHTHTRTHRQRENSIPTTNKVCGGYNYPWSPTIHLALTVAGPNRYRQCKYRRYTINVRWLLTLVAILG